MLLDQLQVLNSSPAGQANDQKAEQRLSYFFNFAIECVKEGLLANEDILNLFEDLYECCQESQLSRLFPLFERAIHGSKAEGSFKI